MSTYSFIVNPKAGKGRGEKVYQLLKTELRKRGLQFEILLTEKPSHATELARKASGEVVVAVGGDGTINEVANGIMGSPKILGILPGGSGNDLIKSIGISPKFESAFNQLLQGNIKPIDCATVRCEKWNSGSPSGNSSERFFVNGVGIGFDAAVAERTRQIKHLSGLAVYLLAVFQTLGKYKSPDFKILLDTSSRTSHNLLIAIGNGRCAGDGFYLTPRAEVDDGFLDVCLIDELSVPRILGIMPKVMRGIHEMSDAVQMCRAKVIQVSASQPFFVHADGEIVGHNVNEVHIQIVSKALHVIVG